MEKHPAKFGCQPMVSKISRSQAFRAAILENPFYDSVPKIYTREEFPRHIYMNQNLRPEEVKKWNKNI